MLRLSAKSESLCFPIPALIIAEAVSNNITKMFFKREVDYHTDLKFEEINKRLNSITEKFHSNSSNKFKFEGKINQDEFNILPTFDYSPNSQLRPEIHGILFKKEKETNIKLEFQLPNGLKIGLILVLILNLGIVLLGIGFSELNDFILFEMWWLILILTPITFLIFFALFKGKVNKSEEILKKTLYLR